MRNKITKGEVAKLLGITRTQIRFYEKKGLIKPAVADNGYYMYSFSNIKELEVILFLREIDTPISTIKQMINTGDDYNYLDILESACDKIELEMKELTKKKKDIERRTKLFK